MGRLVVVSGPSCIGKGALYVALRKFHPGLTEGWKSVVLYNSRASRPGELDGRDYHFRGEEEIESMKQRDGFVVMNVRGDLQALDTAELKSMLSRGDVFFEGNPFVGKALLDLADTVVSMFLTPLSREELVYLKDPERRVDLPAFVTDVMRRKLLRRTQRQKRILSLKDLEDIERRASSAYGELKLASRFGHVIPNHDGEDSENWDAFYYPVSDARRTLLAVADVLQGKVPACAETWETDLLP